MNKPSMFRTERIMLIYCALMLTLPGIVLLSAPSLFYRALADFAPFNRHFMGDAGALMLGLGIGLFFTLRNPAAHRLLIAVAAIGNSIHVANHLYDDFVVDAGNMRHLLTNTMPLLLLSLLLGITWWRLGRFAKGCNRQHDNENVQKSTNQLGV